MYLCISLSSVHIKWIYAKMKIALIFKCWNYNSILFFFLLLNIFLLSVELICNYGHNNRIYLNNIYGAYNWESACGMLMKDMLQSSVSVLITTVVKPKWTENRREGKMPDARDPSSCLLLGVSFSFHCFSASLHFWNMFISHLLLYFV